MSIIYDGLKTVTITFLKKYHYLEPDRIKPGVINWSQNGKPTGSISIWVSTYEDERYLELSYNANGTPIKYRVQLVTIPSNLGFGLIWYFICPATGKRCRKLYSIGNYFYHRTACRGIYENQTKSKYYRVLEKAIGGGYKSDKLYEQLHQKHFKQTYAGRPTRNYLRLTRIIEKAERLNMTAIRQYLKT